jgi:carbon-monoxide dehydrogenase large subunit
LISQSLGEAGQARAVRRIEDGRFVTGGARFLDDVNAENQAYMGLVLSPHAHARIKSIDLSRARSSPEFIDALTGDDLVRAGVRTVSQNPWPRQRPARRYHLAVGSVRFAGEPVAAILVRGRYAVEDLVERVEVEYEELPVVATVEESKKGRVMVYEDWNDNVSQRDQDRKGDADGAISTAAHVIKERVGIARQAAAPIEPHSVLVSYDRGSERYQVFATLQSVHGLQRALSSELGLPRQSFHVRVVDVGGGFGSKGGASYPWPLLACLFAKRTGLPVKWTASRSEEFLEGAPGRDEYCDVTLACDGDGRIVALKGEIECDVGVSGTQVHMPSMSMWTMTGPYSIPNLDLRVTSYVTNKMPIGPVRGAGAPEGCYFIERAMDAMARKVGLDPLELRRRNVVGPERADGVDYQALMDALVRSSGYEGVLRWRDGVNAAFGRGRTSGSRVVAGVGVSLRGESEDDEEEEELSPPSTASGAGSRAPGGHDAPGGSAGAGQPGAGAPRSSGEELSFNSEFARVVLHAGGDVTIFTGSSPHGQGHETTLAQLASDELGVPLGRIRVVWGDTDLVPVGIGTFGSRSAATGGSAVVDASRRVKAALLEIASRALGVDAGALAVEGDDVVEASRPGRRRAISTVAEVLAKEGRQEVSADSKIRVDSMGYACGAHLCALLLDADSGRVVEISRYVVVEDCGRMINETIVEGQIRGGIVHGIGGALLERLQYDERGNLLTSSFSDYCLPVSVGTPEIEVFHRVTPSASSLNGVRGVGESGTIGSYGAVMNALNDALTRVRPSTTVNTAPASPDSVFAALHPPTDG